MPDIGLKGTIAWIIPLVVTAVGFDMIPGGWITAFCVFVIYGFVVYLVGDWWENRGQSMCSMKRISIENYLMYKRYNVQ